MATLGFITDEAFRAALERDREEMLKCTKCEAWKASHVLAGSIIEAVLIDYLIAEAHVTRDVGLKMDLTTAIDASLKYKIISDKSAALSTVVKDYRNLIHPGRSIRSNETVSSNSAAVASALVEMILSEIEQRKRTNYGYTAEQIVTKVEKDSSARSILPHLLKEINAIEIERLLTKVVPDRYFLRELIGEPSDVTSPIASSLVALFRKAFEVASDDLKAIVSRRFVTILKEDAETIVLAYGTAFFRLSDLQYVSTDDAALIKEHYFGRLKDSVTSELLAALDGIGTYLTDEEAPRFVDLLVRVIFTSYEEIVKRQARDRLRDEYFRMHGNAIIKRLEEWARMFRVNESNDKAQVIEELKNELDIPF